MNNDTESIIDELEQKISEFEKQGNIIGQITNLYDLGTIFYSKKNDFQKAINIFHKCITICINTKNKNKNEIEIEIEKILGLTYHNLGMVLKDKNNIKESLKCYMKGLMIYKKYGDKKNESSTLSEIGLIYGDLGMYQKSLDYMKKSLKIRKEINDKNGEAGSLSNIAKIYNIFGMIKETMMCLNGSLMIYKQIGNKKGEADVVGNIANVLQRTGQYNKSIPFLVESLKIQRFIGNKIGIAVALNNLGNAYYMIGKHSEALIYHNESLKMKQLIGDKHGMANSLGNISLVYIKLGKNQESLIYQNKALKIEKELRNKRGIADCLCNLANIYNAFGNTLESLKYHKESLDIQKVIGFKQGECRSYSGIAVCYNNLNKPQEALKYEFLCLKIHQHIKDKQGEADCLGNIAVYSRKCGKIQESLDYQMKSLTIQKTLSNKEGIASSLFNLANIYDEMGKDEESIKYQKEALKIWESTNNVKGISQSLYNIGVKLSSSKKGENIEEGYKYVKKCVEMKLKMLLKFSSKESNFCSFVETFIKTINGLIFICFKLEKFDEILKLIEMTKSLSSLNVDKLKFFKNESLDNLQEFKYPSNVFCLHYYFLTFQEKEVIFLCSTYNGKILHGFINSIKKGQIKDMLTEFRENKTDFSIVKKICCELYNIFIKEFEDELPKNELIIIFPHAISYFVPFYALMNEKTGRYLIQDYILSFSASLKDYEIQKELNEKRQKEKKGKKRRGLFLVDPTNIEYDILDNSKEANDIIKGGGCDKENSLILCKEQLTKSNFTTALTNNSFTFIYIGSHYSSSVQKTFNEFDISGAIVLSNKELLYAKEIQTINFQNQKELELIFLNCCSTGGGKISSHAILGITKAFFDTGYIPSIIITVMNVDSKCAEFIGIRFFDYYHSDQNLSKAECLRNSLLDLLNFEQFIKKNEKNNDKYGLII